jgi:hypothetical protein
MNMTMVTASPLPERWGTMPVVHDWPVQLDVDMILRAQHADPERLRARRSPAVAVAERALDLAEPLLRPAVVYEFHEVRALRHERLLVGTEKSYLSGPLIARHLFAARTVAALVCTVGADLEVASSAWAAEDLALSLALDALASAAVDQLSQTACRWVDGRAEAEGVQASIPLSPGLLGWPVATGQRELFALVEGSEVGVCLNDSCMMVPHKSTSMVIGLGPEVARDGDACDYCSMSATCHFRGDHQHRA